MSRPWLFFFSAVIAAQAAACPAQVTVPQAPAPGARPLQFRDGHFGVGFSVPPGWHFTRRDGEVSTFHADARTAPMGAEMRGVASIDFNPYPFSTFSGAMVYYSVAKHTDELACASQAAPRGAAHDVQEIGGVSFAHGHDERGHICVEERDDVYTAYRKGSCYRFDLELNTFCSVSSGASDLTDKELHDVERRMTGILSTVVLDWSKTGPQPVQVPEFPVSPRVPLAPSTASRTSPVHGGE
jgi:hypothetical protein